VRVRHTISRSDARGSRLRLAAKVNRARQAATL
jgi:hypothetical protein